MRIDLPIELVVFDMAGTTVSEGGAVYRCLRETLATNGLEISAAALNEVKGMDKRDALRLMIEKSSMEALLLPKLDNIHEDFVERIIAFYATDPTVREMPGASETFRRLRQAGIKVALNTGFSRDIVDALLKRLNWLNSEWIDASVTSDEVEQGRPHPAMIRRLMDKLGVTDPSHIVKVGDTPADLLEGKNAGCGLVIGVTEGSSAREVLERFPHDHLIGTVAELPALLGV